MPENIDKDIKRLLSATPIKIKTGLTTTRHTAAPGPANTLVVNVNDHKKNTTKKPLLLTGGVVLMIGAPDYQRQG